MAKGTSSNGLSMSKFVTDVWCAKAVPLYINFVLDEYFKELPLMEEELTLHMHILYSAFHTPS
jgi:hypothetical protein